MPDADVGGVMRLVRLLLELMLGEKGRSLGWYLEAPDHSLLFTEAGEKGA